MLYELRYGRRDKVEVLVSPSVVIFKHSGNKFLFHKTPVGVTEYETGDIPVSAQDQLWEDFLDLVKDDESLEDTLIAITRNSKITALRNEKAVLKKQINENMRRLEQIAVELSRL